MNSNKKVVNYKVSWLFEIYNFSLGSFSIRGRLQNLNFKILKFKRSFAWQDVFKSKKVVNYNVS